MAFTVAMLTKLATKICWKQESDRFETNSETFVTEINIENK